MIWRLALRRSGAALLAAGLALVPAAARADTPVALFKSFAGNVNFTGTQATMRTSPTCDAYSSKTVLSRTLNGIPANAQVLAAHLYWAGSSATADNQVSFDGKAITAQRRYTSRYRTGGTNYDYYGGAADVTAQVAAKKNGTYTFSGLTFSTRNPYCAVEGVLGGFALLVVYSNPATEPFRVLNIYEGFQNMRYSGITLNLSNFKTPDQLGSITGRIGHITWEGDTSLQQQGEDLQFNANYMTDGLNPRGNQFNSRSNINNDTASYGIDFDAYTIGEPILQPGQTEANTVYSSGQDMVLLNVEIVAVPNVPVVDLSMALARTGDPFATTNISYALTVTNNGPNLETGPITVTNTLPAGMAFVSASGTGWTCGHTAGTVTCSYAGALDKGGTLPVITINARVTGAYSAYTNTATVAGQMFDNVNGNNTAVDTATTPELADAPFVFTVGACTDGLSMSAPGSPCRLYTGPYNAADTVPLYLTALNNGVPTALHKTSDRTRSMRFSLTCVNPVANAGVQASFAGVTLPLCLANGATPTASTPWTGWVAVSFPAGQPSAGAFNFRYADVGRLRLNLNEYSTGEIGFTEFVSTPARLALSVTRQDGVANPNNGTTGFAMAGESFNVGISALMSNGAGPPNFGKETVAVGVTVGQDAGPAVEGTLARVGNGAYSGLFAYHEAGSVKLTARLMNAADPGADHYLGYTLPAVETQTIGRFYPAYFRTEVSTGLDCLAGMACPTGKGAGNEELVPGGAAYSEQPFTVTVKPYGLVKADELKNYATSNPIILSAWSLPGPSGLAVAGLQGNTTIAGAAAGAQITGSPSFRLPAKYSPASTTPPSAPTTIYLRAQTSESRAPGSNNVTVSSRRDTAISDEDGVQVVSGRLFVGSNAGSELQVLPIQLTAQYWTGATWESSSGDDTSVIANDAEFTNCTNKLRSGAGCGAMVGVVQPPTTLVLAGGQQTLRLKAPGAGNNGAVSVRVKDALAPWLPSSIGKAVFGAPRSPLIYIREVH